MTHATHNPFDLDTLLNRLRHAAKEPGAAKAVRGILEDAVADPAQVIAGDVLSIGPNAIHTVSCTSEEPCCGIHVYLGNLTQIKRSLFDTEAGTILPFTAENYHKLMRADAQARADQG